MNQHALERILADGRVRLASGGIAVGAASPRPINGDCGYLSLPLGVAEIDAALPGGGLRGGATHEWFVPALDGQDSSRGPWRPPLTILTHLVARASSAWNADTARMAVPPDGLIAWVGRRCWPMPSVLGPTMQRSLFVDPDDEQARFWAIDQALRCPGVAAVVADACGLDMAGSRRLQLAAEAGGVIALLARPAFERGVISAAETRWMVRPANPVGQASRLPAAEGGGTAAPHWPRWSLELLRCKGASLTIEGARWVVEWALEVGRETCALRVPADVERGPREAAAPALRIA